MYLPEILFIFLILFSSGMVQSSPGSSGEISAPDAFLPGPALARLCLFILPGLILVGFFLLKKENRPYRPSLRIRPACPVLALICLASLSLIALGFTLLSRVVPGLPSPPVLARPSDSFSWFVLVLFYLASACLEETYFRVYLETRLSRAKLGPLARLVLSSGLFALCHRYQGDLGLCNAFVSGVFLLLFYRKTRSPCGIVLGPGL
jgi:membrane protease YdiL (CAAX protease family)